MGEWGGYKLCDGPKFSSFKRLEHFPWHLLYLKCNIGSHYSSRKRDRQIMRKFPSRQLIHNLLPGQLTPQSPPCWFLYTQQSPVRSTNNRRPWSQDSRPSIISLIPAPWTLLLISTRWGLRLLSCSYRAAHSKYIHSNKCQVRNLNTSVALAFLELIFFPIQWQCPHWWLFWPPSAQSPCWLWLPLSPAPSTY